MKKPYQIESQRAVKQLEAMASDGNPAVQMVLPMAEMVGWLRQGVGELIRQAGLRLMDLLMQEEVRELVGERSQRQAERRANRWGSERGYCVVMGQKVPVERPRVRSTDDQEVYHASGEVGVGPMTKYRVSPPDIPDNRRTLRYSGWSQVHSEDES